MIARIIKYRVRIILNLLIWAFLLNAAYNNSRNYTAPQGLEQAFNLHVIGYNLLFVIIVYINTLWLIPQFLLRKKYTLYIALFAAYLLLSSAVMSTYSYWLMEHFPHSEQWHFSFISLGLKSDSISWFSYYLFVAPSIFILAFVFSIGLFTQQFFALRKQQDFIQKKQIESELSLLKSQINPHFLFNVLNSIYALSLRKSDETPAIVLKLSDILRYVLYEAKQEKVPVQKEVEMIKDYIALEQVRIKMPEQISIDIQGDMNSHSIAPMLLIPFVENAIKHGMDTMIENGFIKILIVIEQGVLKFKCVNNYKERKEESKIGGIGLENVRKRLSLLYTKNSSLDIQQDKNVFDVSLTINLNA